MTDSGAPKLTNLKENRANCLDRLKLITDLLCALFTVLLSLSVSAVLVSLLTRIQDSVLHGPRAALIAFATMLSLLMAVCNSYIQS